MAEPTLEQIFGIGARQDNNNIIISKDALVGVGLTKVLNQNAEAIFAGILLVAQKYLNDAGQVINPDIQIIISKEFTNLTQRNNKNYREFNYNVKLQAIDNSVELKPQDF